MAFILYHVNTGKYFAKEGHPLVDEAWKAMPFSSHEELLPYHKELILNNSCLNKVMPIEIEGSALRYLLIQRFRGYK